MQIRQALEQATQRLHKHEQPRLDAEVLLAHVLNKPRSYLHAWPEAELSNDQEARFLVCIEQRAEGQPVAYLTGCREFWSLDLEVTPDTLIPRPETELLVEQALTLLPENASLRVADFGTGSGAIAIALAHERRHWQLYAVDRSLESTRLARRNAQRLGIHNLSLFSGNWSQAVASQYLDAMVSNPPYVADTDPHLQQGDVRFEPSTALAAGPLGLNDLELLIEDAPRVLKPGGWVLLEHGLNQAEQVRILLKNRNLINVSTTRDLAGLDRVSCAQKPA